MMTRSSLNVIILINGTQTMITLKSKAAAILSRKNLRRVPIAIEEQENQPGMNNPNPEDSRIDKDDPGKNQRRIHLLPKAVLLILLVLILLGITVGAAGPLVGSKCS